MLCLSFSEKTRIKQGCILTENSDLLVYSYAKGMLSSLYFKPNPKNILMLGMGIGTLAKTFAEILPNTHIDVVDINASLINIDKKYFDFDIEKYQNISFHLMDAFEYTKNIKNTQYDIIIGDAFDEKYIPEKFLTNEYMKSIKNIMSDDGIFSNNSFIKSKTRALEDKLIDDNFGKKYLTYEESGSKIIFTTKDNIEIPLHKITKDHENYILFHEIFKKYGIEDDKILKKLK